MGSGIHPLIPSALSPKRKKKFENFLKQTTIVEKKRNISANTAYAVTACSVPPQASTHICQRSPFGHIIPLANIAYAGTLFVTPGSITFNEIKIFTTNITLYGAIIELEKNNLNFTVTKIDGAIL